MQASQNEGRACCLRFLSQQQKQHVLAHHCICMPLKAIAATLPNLQQLEEAGAECPPQGISSSAYNNCLRQISRSLPAIRPAPALPGQCRHQILVFCKRLHVAHQFCVSDPLSQAYQLFLQFYSSGLQHYQPTHHRYTSMKSPNHPVPCCKKLGKHPQCQSPRPVDENPLGGRTSGESPCQNELDQWFDPWDQSHGLGQYESCLELQQVEADLGIGV
mmetsp:Transcript_6205/g.38562  ORF Transcript_6205/g.38562 Transcript_6205/m.38562 type:complete len:217 (-) Transcript_6205:3246-3896(-)